MKIWEPKPPGTLWATPGLLRGRLYLTLGFLSEGWVNIPHVRDHQTCTHPSFAMRPKCYAILPIFHNKNIKGIFFREF